MGNCNNIKIRDDIPKDMPTLALSQHFGTCFTCGARCCRYITKEIETPRSLADFEKFRRWVAQPGVKVFICQDGIWHTEFISTCKHLRSDMGCGIYTIRPQICEDYKVESCEYTSDLTPRQEFFDEPSLRKYLIEILGTRWRVGDRLEEKLLPAPEVTGEAIIEIDVPDCKADFDTMRWYTSHPGCSVAIAGDAYYFCWHSPEIWKDRDPFAPGNEPKGANVEPRPFVKPDRVLKTDFEVEIFMAEQLASMYQIQIAALQGKIGALKRRAAEIEGAAVEIKTHELQAVVKIG
ncbi:MAG: hypothetical protein NUW37_07245 [Planctomycetes bacterium]|nr:hypothetical protein [Planctomycetota bacterium]